MDEKLKPLIDRFIDLIDHKYKDNILKSADKWERLGHKYYSSLNEAMKNKDYFCVWDALTDLTNTYTYDFYLNGTVDCIESKEGIIFEDLAYQVNAYAKGESTVYITKDDYEWIKNAPSLEECIERDKLSRNIINNVYMGPK